MYVVLFAVFFTGYFPGGLCADTAGNMLAAMRGVIYNVDPPLLQWLTRALQQLTVSQWPLLALQLLWYFTGFFLISAFFAAQGRVRVAAGFAVLSVFPHLLYLQTLVIKDVLIAGLWVMVVGCCLWLSVSIRRKARAGWLVGGIVAVLCAALLRDNTFVAVPPLLWMIAVSAWPRMGRRKTPVWQWLLACVVITVLVYHGMRVVNGWMMDRPNRDYKSDFIVRQVMTGDLVGMSLRQGHQGVTAEADLQLKERLDHLYAHQPVFWFSGDEFETLFPEPDRIAADWIAAVRDRPDLYIRHRAHFFSRYFVRNFDAQLMWVGNPVNVEPFVPMLQLEGKKVSPYIPPDWLQYNAVYMWSVKTFHFYFRYLADAVFVALCAVLAFFVFQVFRRRARGEAVTAVERVAFGCVLTGVMYVAPLLFFAQHTEARYVYGALVLWFVAGGLVITAKGRAISSAAR